jgi:hypothetical protein
MRNWSNSCEAAAGRLTLWKVMIRKKCINSWPVLWKRSFEKFGKYKAMRGKNDTTRPRWPMIVLNSPKGWTGPKVVDGLQIEGTFRAHQIPLLVDSEHPDHLKLLENWMKSYKAEELFDKKDVSCRNWPSWRPKVSEEWALILTPMAGYYCTTCYAGLSEIRGECAITGIS